MPSASPITKSNSDSEWSIHSPVVWTNKLNAVVPPIKKHKFKCINCFITLSNITATLKLRCLTSLVKNLHRSCGPVISKLYQCNLSSMNLKHGDKCYALHEFSSSLLLVLFLCFLLTITVLVQIYCKRSLGGWNLHSVHFVVSLLRLRFGWKYRTIPSSLKSLYVFL